MREAGQADPNTGHFQVFKITVRRKQRYRLQSLGDGNAIGAQGAIRIVGAITMDKPREGAGRKRLIKRAVIGTFLVSIVGAGMWGVNRLPQAAQSVDFATVWPDTVKRGPMIRQVRGLGTLVPEEVLLIPANTDGRVEKIILRPGATVKPDTILLVLNNQELENAAFAAEWQVKEEEARMKDLKVRLESQHLDLTASTAKTGSELNQARLTADRDEALTKLGLKADLEYRLTKAKAEELEGRTEIEKKRLLINLDSIKAQLYAEEVKIENLRAAYELKRKQVDQLKIRAGVAGVLQQLPVEVGQRVAPGELLAKVAQPWKLKAELKIAETQAKDIQVGQIASIDTRNGLIAGTVSRIDPASANGTVTIDVKLTEALPQGARPDLSVDGTIDIERIADALFMGRPVFGQTNTTVKMFKFDPTTKEAIRVPVKLGRSSVTSIEILEGLKLGDHVILSDMSQYDSQDRLKLK